MMSVVELVALPIEKVAVDCEPRLGAVTYADIWKKLFPGPIVKVWYEPAILPLQTPDRHL